MRMNSTVCSLTLSIMAFWLWRPITLSRGSGAALSARSLHHFGTPISPISIGLPRTMDGLIWIAGRWVVKVRVCSELGHDSEARKYISLECGPVRACSASANRQIDPLVYEGGIGSGIALPARPGIREAILLNASC